MQQKKIFEGVVSEEQSFSLNKVSRFERNDREDIEELARFKLIDVQELEKRATEAFDYYVGNPSMLRLNLIEAADIIRAIQGR